MRVLYYPCADVSEEAGKPQIGHHDHHAEEQDDRVVIDSCVSFLNSEDVESQHQAGADDCRAGTIYTQEGDPANGKDQVSPYKNEGGGEQAPIVSSRVHAARYGTYAALC